MNAILKFTLTLSLLLISFVGFFLLAGFLQSANFQASKTEIIPAPANQVWKFLVDIEDWPNRRREIASLEILEMGKDGFPLKWKQLTNMQGEILFERGEFIPEKVLESKMVSSSFQMTGSWKYELEAQGNSTKLTLLENSTIKSPMVRGAFLFSGRDSNLKQELELVLNHFLR